jgi:hypothetical protein
MHHIILYATTQWFAKGSETICFYQFTIYHQVNNQKTQLTETLVWEADNTANKIARFWPIMKTSFP